jgi:rhodanese-related sulfurtransferase
MDEPGTFAELTTEAVLARLKANPDLLLLDVRWPQEWESHHILGVLLLPMPEVLPNLPNMDPARETIVVCEHGVRSHMVAEYLATQAGFTHVSHLRGGMSEWTGDVETGV